jgi:23S rRNA (uracil1939-C5)-methyltransferase
MGVMVSFAGMGGVYLRKDEIYECLIEDMGVQGEGIGRASGIALFVKDTVVGDFVKVKIMRVKKNLAFGRLVEILKHSPYRVTAPCPVAKQCGGCQLQALSYEKQLEFKENRVRNNLKRIGGFDGVELEPIHGIAEEWAGMASDRADMASDCTDIAGECADVEGNGIGMTRQGFGDDEHVFGGMLYYRNKAQVPIGKDKDGNIEAGYYGAGSHRIVPSRKCLLGPKISENVLDILIDFMERYKIEPYDETSRKGLVRHVLIRQGFATGEVMVCLVINGRNLPQKEKLADSLSRLEGMTSISLNVNEEDTNVILGKEIIPLWGKDYITDSIPCLKNKTFGGESRKESHGESKGNEKDRLFYKISPLSFYQVNPIQTQKLYAKVLEYANLTGEEIVWDLYCGIGSISLFLAGKAKKVYGIEVVPGAIADAKENAIANGIDNAEFILGKVEEVLPNIEKKEKAQVVVLDPPRKGCDRACLEAIVEMGPQKVVYVSCDSATLARDLRYLCEQGYQIQKGKVCDMFPMTVREECVMLMSRIDK